MSKAAAAEALNVTEEIQTVDSGNQIQLDNLNESMERLNDIIQEEETSFSYSPQTVRDLQRAHKSINTIDRQINIATTNITANENEIAGLKRERENPDTSEDRRKEIDSEIRELQEKNTLQREFINDLKPRLRNQLVSIRETLHKMLYQDKILGQKLKTLFREQGVTVTTLMTAITMTIAAIVEGIILATRRTITPKPKPEPPNHQNHQNQDLHLLQNQNQKHLQNGLRHSSRK